jgi:hypothetical protein
MGDMADFILDSAFDQGLDEYDGFQGSPSGERALAGIWRNGDGTEIKISEMSDNHLANALAMIERRGWETPYCAVLRAESKRRNLR